ncbi:MAG: hypothetical protein J6C06_08065 [Lachnospiraceae bacterium]|nr:hypothetical protein [Lachnospiraceae bacterium]
MVDWKEYNPIELFELKRGKVFFYGQDFGFFDCTPFAEFWVLNFLPVLLILSDFRILSVFEMDSYTICIVSRN